MIDQIMATYSRTELRDIIRDELKKIQRDEFDKILKAQMKNGELRDDVLKLIKNALAEFAKFMWIKKGVWQNEIR